ncbi:MAG: SpoIIE family protein phosphatase [Bryobacterales bacterium]|nr:SpoIIE family protein phosphatase [Bryobacteraceae bacterium]MDW8130868.1 SpoIIE family protein phosphatase [Bryobacterales bacterium]
MNGVEPPPAVLVVSDPGGDRSEVPLAPLPFHIGRLAENQLALRDGRISRRHARIVFEEGAYTIEDLGSRHGLFVNGERVSRHRLRHGDRIGFGFPDSYELVFRLAGGAGSLLAQTEVPGSHLARLRAMLEVARALHASLSTEEVLATVVEAALAVTGCSRGFLLLWEGGRFQVRVARTRTGPLPGGAPRLPARQLERAALERRELFWIAPDAVGGGLAIPLVKVRTGGSGHTSAVSAATDTIGLLYMEGDGACEPPAGSRELLTTLALEASTVLENARLLEEQWVRQRMEQELRLAQRIQESLLPRRLPCAPWLRAAGGAIPSREVGGDYYELRRAGPDCFVLAIADVSGKGVGAALLAALLQGMFLAAPHTRVPVEELMARANRFLLERTGGEQYATVIYGQIEAGGRLRVVNAGHPPWLRLHGARLERHPARSLPLGLIEEACYVPEEVQLDAGDLLLFYTDGLTEARNQSGELFGLRRLEDVVAGRRPEGAQELYDEVLAALDSFTGGVSQSDDIALMALEFGPERQPSRKALDGGEGDA